MPVRVQQMPRTYLKVAERGARFRQPFQLAPAFPVSPINELSRLPTCAIIDKRSVSIFFFLSPFYLTVALHDCERERRRERKREGKVRKERNERRIRKGARRRDRLDQFTGNSVAEKRIRTEGILLTRPYLQAYANAEQFATGICIDLAPAIYMGSCLGIISRRSASYALPFRVVTLAVGSSPLFFAYLSSLSLSLSLSLSRLGFQRNEDCRPL